MQELKNKLFAVLGRSMPINDFENWLYSSSEIKNRIQTDDLVYQVVSLNYRDKYIFHELDKVCFSVYSYEEFLIDLIEQNCFAFDEKQKHQAVNELFDKISPFFSFQTNYSLIDQLYWLEDEWELANYGYANKDQVFREVVEFVEQILNFFSVNSIEEKIELLSKGIEIRSEKKVIFLEEAPDAPKRTRKWFQFWRYG